MTMVLRASAVCLLLICSGAAQEYVASKSFPDSPDKVFEAAKRTFTAMNGHIEESDINAHTMRVRFGRNGAGYRGANLTADYARFRAYPGPKKGQTRAEVTFGHAPLSSLPNMGEALSHSPIPGAKSVNVRDKASADAFFRQLKKQLKP